MNTKITDDLIQEATKLLERWAKKRNFLEKGKKLVVTMSIENLASVSLKMEDQTVSARLDKTLAQPIKTLILSSRTTQCLLNGCFYIIGDIARKTENDLLKLRNFGKKSLREIQSQLKLIDLTVDMNIPVGPLEREALLQSSFHRYVHFEAIQPLEAAGIVSVKDFISKTEDEIISMLKHCDPKKIGEPRLVYYSVRQSLTQRGLIL